MLFLCDRICHTVLERHDSWGHFLVIWSTAEGEVLRLLSSKTTAERYLLQVKVLLEKKKYKSSNYPLRPKLNILIMTFYFFVCAYFTYCVISDAFMYFVQFVLMYNSKEKSIHCLYTLNAFYVFFCWTQSQLSLGEGRVLPGQVTSSLMAEADMQGDNRTSGAIRGSVSCSRTLQHAAQLSLELGFEPATFRSLGNLLFLLSYSRPSKEKFTLKLK